MSPIKKVLCLHGYSQNGLKLKSSLGAVRKAMKGIDFVFVDAPHIATEPRSDNNNLQGGHPYSWWNMTTPKVWQDTQKSLIHLLDVVKNQGPFEGIFGFSQGAAIIPILLTVLRYKELPKVDINSLSGPALAFEKEFVLFMDPLIPAVESLDPTVLDSFKFAICAGGFAPGKKVCLRLLANRESKLDVSSLHIMGKTDDVISNDMSMSLSSLFKNPDFIVHTGGHYIPSSREYTNLYSNFVSKL
ncbi:hypothetical protein BB560_001189 [Smittium megazygosporum]|uniref:Serine hydrolase domain-containing protein n=1 Tax=Smittium megazygosporum TaxID=133381 RepID=A0A2T9YST3_9FUNG|nr:hypothetical protein BB560_005861 [Smittium megazygosporum]PVV04311.1 hypothetical protein BB560_001189 [Smittium megazygosporum]